MDALRLLLSDEVGAELEAKDSNGWTALHLASRGGHVDALRLLLSDEVGAELEVNDGFGRTPIDVANRPEAQAVLSAHTSIVDRQL